jgi:hypothetical protein
MTRHETVRPHPGLCRLFDFFSNLVCELESFVTESNRRPSPYHACRFRLMASAWVGLPQVAEIAVSEYVALRLPLPGVVVTCLVTGSGVPPPRIWFPWINPYRQSNHCSGVDGRVIVARQEPHPRSTWPESAGSTGGIPAGQYKEPRRGRWRPDIAQILSAGILAKTQDVVEVTL